MDVLYVYWQLQTQIVKNRIYWGINCIQRVEIRALQIIHVKRSLLNTYLLTLGFLLILKRLNTSVPLYIEPKFLSSHFSISFFLTKP